MVIQFYLFFDDKFKTYITNSPKKRVYQYIIANNKLILMIKKKNKINQNFYKHYYSINSMANNKNIFAILNVKNVE